MIPARFSQLELNRELNTGLTRQKRWCDSNPA